MPRTCLAGGLVAAVCLLADASAVARQRPAVQAAPADAVVLGRVVDGDSGEPVSGAVVTLTDRLEGPRAPGRDPERAITGRDGYFVFRDLPAGSIGLAVSKAGYQNGGYGAGRAGGNLRPIALVAGETKTDVVVRLWKFASIAGVVVDEFGDPLVAVEVRAVERRMVAGVAQLRVSGNASTDDRGRYLLSHLPAGDYLVTVPASTSTAPATSGGALNQSGIRADGALIVNQIPSLQPAPPRPGQRVQIYRTMFHPSAVSPEQARALTLTSGARIQGVNVQMLLTPAMRIRGALLDAAGTPVPATDLRLVTAGPWNGQGGSWDVERTTTGPDGAFAFSAVPPGDYDISTLDIRNAAQPASPSPEPRGGSVPMMRLASQVVRWAEARVSVGATDVEGLVVTLHRGLTVSGRFEFRGAGPQPTPDELRRVTVALQPVGHLPPRLPRAAQTGEDGRFETAGHPPGRYLVRVPAAGPRWTVEAILSGNRDVSLDPFVLDDDLEHVTVIFTDSPSRAEITGTVEPVTDESLSTYVVAIPANYQRWIADGISPQRASMQPVSSGEYHLAGLPPGDYLIAAVALAGPPELQDPDFIGRLAAAGTRVTLAPRDHRVQALRATAIRQEAP